MRKYRPKHEIDVLDNSIERVINTTIKILRRINGKNDDALNELVEINLQDWRELKETTVRLWDAQRNMIFQNSNNDDK